MGLSKVPLGAFASQKKVHARRGRERLPATEGVLEWMEGKRKKIFEGSESENNFLCSREKQNF